MPLPPPGKRATTAPVANPVRRSESAPVDFQELPAIVPARLVLSVEGVHRSGKDHFALTAGGDTCIHSLDDNLEAVARKFRSKKRIVVCKYRVPAVGGSDAATIEKAAGPEMVRLKTNFLKSLRDYRNVIVDTETELWELHRLANFGTWSKKAIHYAPVNSEYKELLREPYHHNANVFWLRKLVDEWEDYTDTNGKLQGRKTGRMEAKGFSNLPYFVQASLWTWKETVDGQVVHHVHCKDSTHDPALEGYDWTAPNCSFADVASLMVPEVDVTAW